MGGITPGENHTAGTKFRQALTQFRKPRFLVRQINSQYKVSFASQSTAQRIAGQVSSLSIDHQSARQKEFHLRPRDGVIRTDEEYNWGFLPSRVVRSLRGPLAKSGGENSSHFRRKTCRSDGESSGPHL